MQIALLAVTFKHFSYLFACSSFCFQYELFLNQGIDGSQLLTMEGVNNTDEPTDIDMEKLKAEAKEANSSFQTFALLQNPCVSCSVMVDVTLNSCF